MRSKPIRLISRIERAWEEYRAARMRAEHTMKLEDGIVSARAYARFLALFLPQKREGKGEP